MVKEVNNSLTEQTYLIRPEHLNSYDKLFGGKLMQWIDEMASIVARRHCQTEITTAAIDNLNFKKSASRDDMIVLVGRVTYVGRTSMEIRVDTYVEEPDGTRKMINRAYVVMVSVDKQYKPLPVPELELKTESEKAEWEGGKKRYELRRQRRMDGF